MAEAYTPHNWISNELITENQLNHIEQGIKNADQKAARQVQDIINNAEELKDVVDEVLHDIVFSADVVNKVLTFKFPKKEEQEEQEEGNS